MKRRAFTLSAPHVAVIAFLGCLLPLSMPARTSGQEAKALAAKADRDREADEIAKQIEALKKKLEELKKEPVKPAPSEAAPNLPQEWVEKLVWRSIGPANMGGRIVALSVFEADPTTFWVGTASGGLLKTTNGGTTYEHQFDREATVSVGDVCVAPSDKEIVWVGTGENNPRNSVSYGDGVYKSTDGGKKWTHVGLKKSFQIGRILIHPKNPDIVYVGALGRLYGPNEERGLFKTTDGGKTWEKILYVDDKTGVIDAAMDPNDPETLIVATYERQRDGYDTNDPKKKWGPGSGLWKTTNGGKTFKKLAQGLPTCNLGRIGINYYRKDPNVVFIILESEKIGLGPTRGNQGNGYVGIFGETTEGGVKLTEVVVDGPADRAGLKADDVLLAFGDKAVAKYEDLLDLIRARNSGDKVKVKFRRDNEEKEVEVTIGSRQQGFARGGVDVDPNRPFGAQLGGQRENVQEQQGAEGYQYGGVYKSTDGGETWTRVNSYNPRPMYFSKIRVDPSDDKIIWVLGVQLYRSMDGGKTFGPVARNTHADGHVMWINPRDGRHVIYGNDGGHYVTFDRGATWDHHNHVAIGQFYHVAIDPRMPSRVYGGLQDNGSWGGPTLGRAGGGMFGGGGAGPINEDWISIGGGDGFTCRVDFIDPDVVYGTSQNGAMFRRNLRTGQTASIRPRPQQGQRLRFNWNTPFILSSHNPRIFYCAGNFVFRCLDQGRDLRQISPAITATPEGSATALAESARNPNVLYVGTDDGYLWVTRNGGTEWTNVTKNVGLPGLRYVAMIQASKFVEGRAYACFDAHRSDDDNPYLYVTEDFGQTWKPIHNNLPWGSTRCLHEDPVNANLLYCGTEFGIWVSLNRGESWVKMNNNLPTVAVHELAFHPTNGEMVAATHGRSLWVVDVNPLRQMTQEALTAKATLYKPTAVVRWIPEPARGRTLRKFVGENPTSGATIYYSLGSKAEKVALRIIDIDGKVVREFSPDTGPGLHKYNWNLIRSTAQAGRPAGAGAGGAGGRRPGEAGGAQAEQRPGGAGTPAAGGQTAGRQGGRGQLGTVVPTGTYRVVLVVDGEEFSQTVKVEPDPTRSDEVNAEEIVVSLDEENEEEEDGGGLDG